MTDTTPTAAYVAKRILAERGFTPGTVAEARPLAEAADLVITKADGMGLQIRLIVDRETDPTRRFELPLAKVVEVARQCLHYTGKINGTKIPVGVQILEVGPNAGDPGERARLKALARNWAGKDRVTVSAWTLDTTTRRVSSTALFNGLGERRYLEKILREPRKPDSELVPVPPAAISEGGPPLLTYAMLAVLFVVFAAEHGFAVAPSQGALGADVVTLIALGGLMQSLVAAGEWYRLFTATVLHADVFHLLLNGVALFLGGVVLENLLGRTWLLALFFIGGLGGSLLSYGLNPAEHVSVGASGAIMGLLAAAFVSSYRLPEGAERTQIQIQMMQVLIPSMLPLAMRGGKIDYAAHLGGALAGALVGFILLRTWPRADPLPRFRRAALAIAGAGIVILGYGFTQVKAHYGEYATVATARTLVHELIPDVEKLGEEELIAQSEQLVAQHPRDPRGRFANAVRLARLGDLVGAEREVRHGLDERKILDSVFPGTPLELGMRVLLVQVLQMQNRQDDAREAARPVCASGPGGAMPEQLRPFGVCP